MTTHFSIASISNWCTCSPLSLGLCYVTHITLADIHPKGALAVMSLAIFNSVIAYS